MTELDKALAHYTQLAKTPGWKKYCWHQVQQMAKDCPELYADLPQRLTAAMKT